MKNNYETIHNIILDTEPPQYRKHGLHGYDLFVNITNRGDHYEATILRFPTMDDMIIYMKTNNIKS